MYYYQLSLLSCNIPLIKTWMHNGRKQFWKCIIIFVFLRGIFYEYFRVGNFSLTTDATTRFNSTTNKDESWTALIKTSLPWFIRPVLRLQPTFDFFRNQQPECIVCTGSLFDFFSRHMDFTLVLPNSIFFQEPKTV